MYKKLRAIGTAFLSYIMYLQVVYLEIMIHCQDNLQQEQKKVITYEILQTNMKRNLPVDTSKET